MTQKFLSDIPEDEWWVLCSYNNLAVWEAYGPYRSRVYAEAEADARADQALEVRVVHSVFTS